jgi:hypothetical protein
MAGKRIPEGFRKILQVIDKIMFALEKDIWRNTSSRTFPRKFIVNKAIPEIFQSKNNKKNTSTAHHPYNAASNNIGWEMNTNIDTRKCHDSSKTKEPPLGTWKEKR